MQMHMIFVDADLHYFNIRAKFLDFWKNRPEILLDARGQDFSPVLCDKYNMVLCPIDTVR